MITFKNVSKIFQVDATETIKEHIIKDYFARIETQKETITVKPMLNHIHCKTTGKFWDTETF